MCGICGRIDFALQRPFAPPEILRWNGIMRHRGPDDDGVFVRPGVALAMRRLSIIDLEHGKQPISNEDGTVHVIMNGEIYNYRELRDSLRARGHTLATASDTEVIVHLWEDYGDQAFAHLRGMFAIALWDERTRTLAVARDRLGIKPLYVAARPDGFDFGSELKMLLALPETDRALDYVSLAAYFTIGYIPPPETIYAGIRELEPGHVLTWQAGRGTRVTRFWELRFGGAARTEREWLATLDDVLADAVRSHLVADVPVAAFLSGGLDSAAVVSYMAEAMDEPPRTFTVRYEGSGSPEADESSLAAAAAARCGTRHEIVTVAPRVADVLDDIVRAFDQPMADESSVPTYYLTQAAAEHTKVALSGLGGDELFGGYERHVGMAWSSRLDALPAWARRMMGAGGARLAPWILGRGLRGDRAHRFFTSIGSEPATRYLGFVTRLAWSDVVSLLPASNGGGDVREAVVERLTRHFGPASDPVLSRALAMDYGQYLPGDILSLTDRLSMHHSLEVRVPLVDHRLVELAAALPPDLKVRGSTKKHIFRRLLADRLPAEYFTAPKRGLVGPTASWLRTELRDMVTDALSEDALRDLPGIDAPVVQRIVRHHMRGESDRFGPALWSLLLFARWHQLYIEEPIPALTP